MLIVRGGALVLVDDVVIEDFVERGITSSSGNSGMRKDSLVSNPHGGGVQRSHRCSKFKPSESFREGPRLAE
jgi:hypothetical protein